MAIGMLRLGLEGFEDGDAFAAAFVWKVSGFHLEYSE